MHEIRFSTGAPPRTSLGELPAPLIGWEGETPSPFLTPRRLRRLGLVAPANWEGMSPSFRGDGRPWHWQT